ncbi:PQQ-binding-like beta-propeller repeat protein [Phenylobacterium sp.]|uniref:outer membrane protein assembly factor BamB family protein n=1 Tax=Phenylobacterium sp. TaxID=1871053 RepID=UPI0039834F71
MGAWNRYGRPTAGLAAAALAALLAGASLGGVALAQGQPRAEADAAPHPGKDVYDQACAMCHAAPDPTTRTPTLAGLKRMSAAAIQAALTTGVMKSQGAALEPRQLRDVVAYLAAPEGPVGTAWIEAAMCPADRRAVDLSAKLALAGWGVDPESTRRMSAAQAGLSTRDLANLEVAWALPLPRTSALRSQGVIVGSTLFYAATQASTLLALDTRTGCIKWAVPTTSSIRTSLAFGPLGKGGPLAVIGGDSGGHIQARDPRDGKLIWRVDPRHDKTVPLTGSPILYGDRIIVPISASDVAAAMRPTHECCKSHGAVAAMDAATGKVLWTYHTMEDAKPLGRKNSQGVEMYGPSGAPIWSTPSVDARRGLVFAATGENTSPPATATSDAIVAIDMATGKPKWTFQALADDIWNMSCPIGRGADGTRPTGANCFFAADGKSVLLDHDFGAGPVIFRRPGGRDVILGGQKSGDVWALDAATGKQLWHQKFGEGTALGGVHWGIATDGVRVFAPISDPGVPEPKSASGMHAVNVATGKIAWQWRAKPDCGNGREARVVGCTQKFGLSAAPLVIDGAVLAGALDGRLWVFDAARGKVLAVHDTARAFPDANGQKAVGGSIDATGVFAGAGMVFVNSGYGSFNQTPGNVLVAFRPKR